MDKSDLVARFQNMATRLLRQARLSGGGGEMTSAQYSALSTLYSHSGIALTDLARMEYVSHPTMSRIVAGLSDAGLVARATDAADRRSTRLHLTEDGKAAYQRVFARRLELIGALLARLKPETIADLVEAMEHLPLDKGHDT